MPAEKILIVEDKPMIADIMKSDLEKFGYSIIDIAKSGEEAIRVTKQCKPDLVLMGIHLQGRMDGIEAAKQIHFDSRIPIIFVADDIDDCSLEKSKLAEHIGIVTKPFSIKELQNTIETCLNNYYVAQRGNRGTLQAVHRNLFESAMQGIFRITESGRFINVNASFAALMGYSSPKELLSLAAEAKHHYVHVELHQELLESLKKLGVVKNFEYEAFRKDGTKIWLSQNSRMIHTPECNNPYIEGIVQDITKWKNTEQQLRASEERYSTAIEHCNDGVVINSGDKYLFVNKRFVEMFGYDNAEEIIGKPISMIVHPDESKRVERFALKRQKREPVPSRYEHKAIRKNGEIIDVEISATQMVYKGESVSLVYVRDITEQKTAEKERQHMEIQLRQAQKLEAIGQLAAGIAHEINTPTQYINDNTRFLQDAFADLLKVLEAYGRLLHKNQQGRVDPVLVADVEEAVAEIDLDYLAEEVPKAITQSLEGLNRVTTIVHAMKEFSHPGGEEKQTIDLNHAINNTITVCRNEWKYVAEIAKDLDPNLPLVPCLPGDFNQVILNLIVNAAHAIADAMNGGEKRKGTISISTRHDGNWVEVRIGDTGTGIPEEHRDKIFTPFFTTKEVGKGTGQGLALSRSVIVGKHGGTIDFQTESGKGTVFIIRLPLSSDSIQ
jgi:PAS domain S-box-containing protein